MVGCSVTIPALGVGTCKYEHVGGAVCRTGLSGDGKDDVGELLERRVHDYGAINWANNHLQSDAKIALLFNWSGYLLERERLLGSVEDHVPSRHLLFTHGGTTLAYLRGLGVTHVLSTKRRFLKKSYPFLSESQFEAQFVAPTRQLEDLLLLDAELLFQEGRTRVHRIVD